MDFNNDKWREIEEYPNYLINKKGDIYSKYTNKILNSTFVNGYLRIELKKEGNKKSKLYVHRLVAKTFIPNPENKPKVYFINGNHLDCNVTNLKWGTQKDILNTDVALKNKSKCQKGKPKSKKWKENFTKSIHKKYGVKVTQYTTDGIFVANFNAYGEAQRITGIHASGIRRCCLGIVKTAGGYVWKHSDSKTLK